MHHHVHFYNQIVCCALNSILVCDHCGKYTLLILV